MDGIRDRIKEVSALTVKDLGSVVDELIACKLYEDAAVLDHVIWLNEVPQLDGSLDDVMVAAGAISGTSYKELTQVAEVLEDVGLMFQARVLRHVADLHRELSMLTSEDTNPIGIPLK